MGRSSREDRDALLAQVDRNTRPDLNVGDLLRLYRARRGWSQSQAATSCGVPVSTWRGWEGGKPMPQEAFVARLLAEALGRVGDAAG